MVMRAEAGEEPAMTPAQLWAGRQSRDPLRGDYLRGLLEKLDRALDGLSRARDGAGGGPPAGIGGPPAGAVGDARGVGSMAAVTEIFEAMDRWAPI